MRAQKAKPLVHTGRTGPSDHSSSLDTVHREGDRPTWECGPSKGCSLRFLEHSSVPCMCSRPLSLAGSRGRTGPACSSHSPAYCLLPRTWWIATSQQLLPRLSRLGEEEGQACLPSSCLNAAWTNPASLNLFPPPENSEKAG